MCYCSSFHVYVNEHTVPEVSKLNDKLICMLLAAIMAQIENCLSSSFHRLQYSSKIKKPLMARHIHTI